jgi:uncharacterized sulfatase
MSLFKKIVLLASGLGCILSQSALSAEDDLRGTRPNIVFFLADDQSFPDHAINGNTKVPAATTLAFSKQALVFDRAYTGQAVCAPSRSMLYSGLYPIRNGCFLNHYSIRSGVSSTIR